MKTQNGAEHEYIYARFDEEWAVMEIYDKLEYEVGEVNWENSARPLQSLLSAPLFSEIRMLLFSWYREGNSHMRVL